MEIDSNNFLKKLNDGSSKNYEVYFSNETDPETFIDNQFNIN